MILIGLLFGLKGRPLLVYLPLSEHTGLDDHLFGPGRLQSHLNCVITFSPFLCRVSLGVLLALSVVELLFDLGV